MTDVELHLQRRISGTARPLAGAWLYVRAGGAITRLRTDEHGHALALNPSGDAERAADYGRRHTATVGQTIELFHSNGTHPISDAALNRYPTLFASHVVPAASIAPTQGTVAISPDNGNTLAASTGAIVTLQSVGVVIERPRNHDLWPVSWSLTDDAYHTDGLDQGAALYAGGNLTVTENAAAPAPSDAVRPKPRALRIEGTLEGTATRVRVNLRGPSGATIPLRATPDATTDVDEIEARTSGSRFTASLLIAAPDTAFGEVELNVVTEPAGLGVASGVLLGVQAALVNDRSAGLDGRSAGPTRTEADEVTIVDFLRSPRPDLAQMTAEARARRMLADDIAIRDRPLTPTSTTNIPQPEMPLWMIELQLLGLTKTRLETLLQHRRTAGVGTAGELRLSTSWTLTLAWDGPNSGATTRPYRYSQTFPLQSPTPVHTIRFVIDDAGNLLNVSDGELTIGRTPGTTAPPFPVAGRRSARIVVEGRQRPWGRTAGAPAVDATVVEFQPFIADAADREIMRGGDAILAFANLQIDGTVVDPGFDPSGSAFTAAPAEPLLRPPTHRVRGVNPPVSDVDAIIDALVSERFSAHSTEDHVAMLSLAQWQVTVRNIVRVESVGHHQFDHRPAGRRRFGGEHFGHEHDMPIFGAPAGYGLGQLDSPAVDDDQAWSFLDNLRGSVSLIMHSKARAAHRFMSANLPDPLTDIDRAAFRREVVRRYNGNTEVRFRNGTWELFPTTQAARIDYPNHVLGTTVGYAGPNVAVAFPATQFGPGF